ncbi:GntR family transcriptional regulator [Pseudonocardia phyllosphaerae]|uniref:GntR family transcriptional regulator n=1 Tax=Pseudonocardia phyllosphaerae TaxID=3390502 RepID=UPI00397B4DF2
MTTLDDTPLEFDEPVSLADRAYVAIRDQLVMLDIPPLAPIDDDALSTELGLGRTPVREAVKRLEGERLVVSYARRGTFATAVDISDLRDVSEVRTALEPLAARRAAASASPAMRDELRRLAERVRRLEGSGMGRTELMRWDVSVHRAIYRAAGNRYLEDTLTRYNNLATRIHCMFLDRLDEVARHVDEHCELLHAVADGDTGRAEVVCRAHVAGFEEAIRAVL